MSSLQWTISASSHTSLATIATPLSVSQLLRIERHRGFASSRERPHPKAAQYALLPRHSSQHNVRRTALAPFSGARPTSCKLCAVKVQARPSARLLGSSQSSLHSRYFGTSHGNCQRRRAFSGAIPSLPTSHDPPKKPSSPPLLPNLSFPQHKHSPGKSSTPQNGRPPQGQLFRVRDEDNARTEFPKSAKEYKAELDRLEKAKKERKAARDREQKERIAQQVRELEARLASITKEVADSSSTMKALAQDIHNFHLGVWDKVLDSLGKRLDRLINDSSVYRERTREIRASIDRRRLKQVKREVLAFETENDDLLERKTRYWKLERRCTESAVDLAEELWQFFNDLFMRSARGIPPDRPNRSLTRNYKTRLDWHRTNGSKYSLGDLQLFKTSGLTPSHQQHLRDKTILSMFLLLEDLNCFETKFMREAHFLRKIQLTKLHYQHHPIVFAHEVDSALFLTVSQSLFEASEMLRDAFWYHFEHLQGRQTVHRTQYYSEDNLNANAKQQRMNDLCTFVCSGAPALYILIVSILQLRTLRRAVHGGLAAKQHALLAIHFNNFMSYRVQPADHEYLEGKWLRPERGLASRHVHQALAAIKQHCKSIQEEIRPLWLQFDKFLYYNWHVTKQSLERGEMIIAAWKRGMSLLRTSSGLLRSPSDVFDFARQNHAFNFHRVNSQGSIWQYTDFQGPDGKLVALDYCVDREAADAMAARLTGKSVLGIDLWAGKQFANPEEAIAKGNSARRAVPMLALASDERVMLFHLAAMEDSRPLRAAAEMDSPPLLTRILESPSVVKVGEDINNIRDKLQNYCGVDLRACVELVDFTGKRQKTGYSGQLTRLIREHTRKSLPETTHDMSLIRRVSAYLRWGNDLKVFATRPYAALWLYHQRFNVPKVAHSKLALAQSAGSNDQTQPTESHGYQSTHRSINEMVLKRSVSIAASDLGHVTVSKSPPQYDAWRDVTLSDLSSDLAEALREHQPRDKLPLQDFKIYVLLTRFGQSFDDIRRIFRVTASPTELFFRFQQYNLPVEQNLVEKLAGPLATLDPIHEADRWLDGLLRDRPIARVKRARMALRAYALWHKQGSFTIAEIASVFYRPGQPEYAFELIKRALLNMTWLPKSQAKTRQLFERFEPKHAQVLLAKMRFAPSPTLGAWGQGSDVVDLPVILEREESEDRSDTGISETVPDQEIAAPSTQAPVDDLPNSRPRKTLDQFQASLMAARHQIRRLSRRLEELGPETAAARISPAATALRRGKTVYSLGRKQRAAAKLTKLIDAASGDSKTGTETVSDQKAVALSLQALSDERPSSRPRKASEDEAADRDGHTAKSSSRILGRARPSSTEVLPTVAGQDTMTPRQKRKARQKVESTVQRLPWSASAERSSRASTATKKQSESPPNMQEVHAPEPMTQSQAKIDGSAGKYSKDRGVLQLAVDASQASSEPEVSATTGESETVDEEEALFRKLEEELAISAPEEADARDGERKMVDAGSIGEDQRSVSRKVKTDPTLKARQERKKRLNRRRVLKMK